MGINTCLERCASYTGTRNTGTGTTTVTRTGGGTGTGPGGGPVPGPGTAPGGIVVGVNTGVGLGMRYSLRAPTGDPAERERAGRCQHGLLDKHQKALELALKPVLSTPPSAHQTATVFALTEANAALVMCRDVLMWIYGTYVHYVTQPLT